MPRLRAFLLGLWPVLIAAVVLFSLLPGSRMPDLPLSDKQEHFTAYLGLAVIPVAAVKRGRIALAAALSIACLGVALEFFQMRIPGRAFDARDILANCIGVLIGTLAGLPLRRRVLTAGQTRYSPLDS
ncbi:MAG: VanZ family protein [Acidobacteria bacterium]|nr:VanZ family protein [Acidobacteriota bacterium]